MRLSRLSDSTICVPPRWASRRRSSWCCRRGDHSRRGRADRDHLGRLGGRGRAGDERDTPRNRPRKSTTNGATRSGSSMQPPPSATRMRSMAAATAAVGLGGMGPRWRARPPRQAGFGPLPLRPGRPRRRQQQHQDRCERVRQQVVRTAARAEPEHHDPETSFRMRPSDSVSLRAPSSS